MSKKERIGSCITYGEYKRIVEEEKKCFISRLFKSIIKNIKRIMSL